MEAAKEKQGRLGIEMHLPVRLIPQSNGLSDRERETISRQLVLIVSEGKRIGFCMEPSSVCRYSCAVRMQRGNAKREEAFLMAPWNQKTVSRKSSWHLSDPTETRV